MWTASYGGQKAMIIRSVIDQVVNFTVLDVNEGSETREAEAFISAYAKNGKIAGEYTPIRPWPSTRLSSFARKAERTCSAQVC